MLRKEFFLMNGRKPTRNERNFIAKANLDTYKWLVHKNTTTQLFLLHKDTREKKVIDK